MITWSRNGLAGWYQWLQSRTGRWAMPAWFLGGMVALIVATSLLGWLLASVVWGGDSTIDAGVAQWAADRRSDGLTAFFNVVTDIGDTITLLILGVAVGTVWRVKRGDWEGFEVLAGSYLGALAIYAAVKRIVGRARPPQELALGEVPGLSFPSGHTTGSAAVYTALVLLVIVMVRREAAKWVMVAATGVLVVLIAASRVYLGVHWLGDVVAGLVVGVTWAIWVVTPLYVRRRERGRPVTEEDEDRVHAPA